MVRGCLVVVVVAGCGTPAVRGAADPQPPATTDAAMVPPAAAPDAAVARTDAASPAVARDASPGPAPPDAATDAAAPAGSAWVFDDGVLRVWSLTIADADLAKMRMQAAAGKEDLFFPATLVVGGETVGRVGVRYKGDAGTLRSCFDAKTAAPLCPKLSMKVKFDELDPTLRFHGLKKVNLHSMVWDPTQLHDRLAYKLWRDFSIPAPRSVHAKLMINGAYSGLYALVEAIDGRFTADRWPGAGNGTLYKEAWPVTDQPAYYEARRDNGDASTNERFVAFYRELAQAQPSGVPAVLDRWANLEYLMRYLAVDRAMSNYDGIMAWYCGPWASDWPGSCRNHNYYWYLNETRDRFWLVPWDMDITWVVATPFDGVPAWDVPQSSCAPRFPYGGITVRAPSCDRVIAGLAQAGLPPFARAIQQLLDGPFDPVRMKTDLERWAAQIQDAVAADRNGPGPQRWRNELARLERFLPILRDRLTLWRDGKKITAFALDGAGMNNFDVTNSVAFELGTSTTANGATTVSQRFNTSTAIAGGGDAVLEFAMRNEGTTPWSQSAVLRIKQRPDAGDLSTVRQVRLKIRADSTRTIWLGLDSPKYVGAGTSGRFGWSLPATATATTLTLDVARMALPSWGKPQGDVPATILASVGGLVFSLPAKGLDAGGLLPAGTSDNGWIELDEIEFVR
jgi:hypothetical protein